MIHFLNLKKTRSNLPGYQLTTVKNGHYRNASSSLIFKKIISRTKSVRRQPVAEQQVVAVVATEVVAAAVGAFAVEEEPSSSFEEVVHSAQVQQEQKLAAMKYQKVNLV